MLSASRSLTKGKRAGAPLPEIPELEPLTHGHFGFRFRQSETTVLAGQPAAWKSGFALWLAANFNIPTLYFSADSSSYVVSTRLAAAYLGEETATIGDGLRSGGEGYYEDVLDNSPIRFCFDPNPSANTIKGELDAWVEAWDSYPQLIVIDNLMDVVGDGDSEFAAYKDVLLGLKTINRETEAAVIVLHHMSETGTDSAKPSPRKSLMGKASQTPDNVLSIALDGDRFMVSVVKHRTGRQDPTGQRFEVFRAFPEKNRLTPWAEPTTVGTAAWSPSQWAEEE